MQVQKSSDDEKLFLFDIKNQLLQTAEIIDLVGVIPAGMSEIFGESGRVTIETILHRVDLIQLYLNTYLESKKGDSTNEEAV